MGRESTLQIEAELEDLSTIRRFVEEAAMAIGADPEVIPDVLLAVTEAATNIILHGYHGQSGIIEIAVSRAGNSLVICLRDQAGPFDPTSVPPPDLNLPLEQRTPGGLGVYLMRQHMDEMSHRITAQGGNELTLIKKEVV